MQGTKFEFTTAGRIIFGPGTVAEIGKISRDYGTTALVVVGIENAASDRLIRLLQENQVAVVKFLVLSEPTVQMVTDACSLAEQAHCQFAIGFGGGSAIDTAKAVAALVSNPGEIEDYLEVIGKGKPLQNPSLPVIAIPTTAGTGAEVTRNAVVSVPEQRVKVSLRSPSMLPRLALIDPELTLSLPAGVTASTGLDALTQVIEPFVSNQSNPMTDALCRTGIERSARSLRQVYFNGDDLAARQDMCLVSLFGGLALANAKLGAVHGFAGVIGGMFPGPHGAICARLLPIVIAANVNALKKRDPEGGKLKKFDDIGFILSGERGSAAQDAVTWIENLTADLVVPPLSEYGMSKDDIPVVVEKSARASSMKGNPIELTEAELTDILIKAL